MRTPKNLPFKSKPKYAAVVEAECESRYTQMLKRNEPQIGFDLSPKIPQKKKLEEQYARVLQLANDYDKVFWIIDCDVVEAESRLVKKGAETEKQKLEKYIQNIELDYKDRVIVIRNNPCLEYWLLLHFESTSAAFTNCDDARKRLKKHLPDYAKSQAFYTKQDNDIYLQLKPNLDTAIKNARKIAKQAARNKDASVSEMYKLFEELGLVKKED